MNRIPTPRLIAYLIGFAILSCLGMPAAFAATVTAMITDDAGRPLADAVVMLAPEPGTPMPAPERSRIATATIDQTDEVFVPPVVVIRSGGTVVFRNSDGIRHHVYSFAPVRRFEMVQAPGETSEPVRFDKPGAVAIGCNIHDHMIAHVFVTDAPWAIVTDAQGRAILPELPAGQFVATVWHARLRPRSEPVTRQIALTAANASLAVSLSVLPPRRPRGHDY